MCCILFKWNKLRPLLQVAKLSVYNLSNKHVFYSGFCCVFCYQRSISVKIMNELLNVSRSHLQTVFILQLCIFNFRTTMSFQTQKQV